MKTIFIVARDRKNILGKAIGRIIMGRENRRDIPERRNVSRCGRKKKKIHYGATYTSLP
ncbi:MAG: hypothetical protein R6W73_08390 [Candidatus Saliniplasma sp.]